MNPLAWIKLGGSFMAVVALGAGLGWLHHRLDLAAVGDRHNACVASIAGKKGAGAPDVTCDPPVAALVKQAAEDDSCDHALALGVTAGNCSAAVKRVVAEREASAAEAANLHQQLEHARADQTAAVARAAARGQALARKTTHAQAILDTAPRDGAGDSVLDAQRLRDLAGLDPALDR